MSVLKGGHLTDHGFPNVKVEFERLTANPFLASQWLRGENGKKDKLEVFRIKIWLVKVLSMKWSTKLSLIQSIKNESAKNGLMQACHQIEL